MSGITQLIDIIEMKLGVPDTQELLTVYINVYDNSLSRKWLSELNDLLKNNFHLEKNFCFLGFTESQRNAEYIIRQINKSITSINEAKIGYTIDDVFTIENTITKGLGTSPMGDVFNDYCIIQDRMNSLHRYFEDLQGVSGRMSPYYTVADPETRWHIRQLNLLCHEYESLILSVRKDATAPMWKRPSQLMCFLNAPRFTLDEDDFELFGIETIARPLGGVFVGVNKAVGKHHWEVYKDEGAGIEELKTTTLRGQTEAAGDFDIEWANSPGGFPWMIKDLAGFRQWLIDNGFDPEDKSLTIGHPQVGQIDLTRSFGTEDYRNIWAQLNTHLNVYSIRTSNAQATYEYCWSDKDYMEKQIKCLG